MCAVTNPAAAAMNPRDAEVASAAMASTAMASTASNSTLPVRPRQLNPAKLRLSKWTAVSPSRREKHWLVVAVHEAAPPAIRPEFVDLEAVHSRRVVTLPWRELTDAARWLQGWK